MKCPDCGEPMVMISGLLVCPVCDIEESLNKTMDDKDHWIQGDKDEGND